MIIPHIIILNLHKNSKINKFLINITDFLDFSLFYFTDKSLVKYQISEACINSFSEKCVVSKFQEFPKYIERDIHFYSIQSMVPGMSPKMSEQL